MHVPKPLYSKEEFARRGDEIYDREISPRVGPADEGKFVVIDIETGEYEVDQDELAASDRLLARRRDAQMWTRRVGSRYARRWPSLQGERRMITGQVAAYREVVISLNVGGPGNQEMNSGQEMLRNTPAVGRRLPAQGVLHGRKQTEAGGIPSGWVLVPIREFAPLQRGFDLPTSQLRPGPHPVVYSNGVLQHHEWAMVKGPGVVTGRSGTIGQVHFIEKDYWPHNTTLWVTSFRENDPKYVYYLYTYLNLARFLSGSGVPTLNRNDVHQHLVARPPLPEQRAIAEALSDVDELIGSLEKLIAKKRAIKQAAMQELLTGKTRLPGFSGAWTETTLGEFCSTYSGGTPSTSKAEFYGGHIPWITSSDLNTRRIRDVPGRITQEGFDSSASRMVSRGDIVFALYGATAGVVAVTEIEAAVNQAVLAVIPKNCDSEYLFQYLESRKDEIVQTYAQGGQPNLSGAIIRSLRVLVPPVHEDTAIAAVLSDMDAEIAVLERRRDKTRAIKQGMMQQLLTGRVRLVKPE